MFSAFLCFSTDKDKRTCEWENELFSIECLDNSMIEIISASYRVSIGGWQNTALTCPGEHSLPDEFYDLCLSQQSCQFNISTIFIGDKCQGDIARLESYLEISYSCEGNNTVLYKNDVDVTFRHHILIQSNFN